MRRAVLIVMLMSLPIVLILLILSIEESSPQAWQVELDKYMVYKGAVVSGTLKTKLVDRGARAWHFSRIMSRVAFGDDPHFGTDYGYDGKRKEGGSTQLPYPPETLWCALLTADPQLTDLPYSDPFYTVVIIAEHQEFQNTAIVVHELAGNHIPLVQSLSLVGCREVMEEIQFSEANRWA